MNLIEYQEVYRDKWNQFLEASANGTLFHNLDFLGYHGSKFSVNEKHLIWLKGESLFAIMPLAIFEENGKKIARSPYGASFGGIIGKDNCKLKHTVEIVDSFITYCREHKIDEVFVTPTPVHYFQESALYWEYAMSQAGFNVRSRDLFNVVSLPKTYEETWEKVFEGRARTSIRKKKDNFEVLLNASAEEFFPILMEDKIRHNNAKPTHYQNDLKYLKDQFPDRVFFDIAQSKENKAKAGICYFLCNPRVTLVFYMAQQDAAVGQDGTNVLLEHGFRRAIDLGCSYLDFGGSTVGYTIENMGVSRFKESFGATGLLRETYHLNLRS